MNKQQQTWSGVVAGVALLLALGGCDDGTTTGTGAQSTLGKSAEFAKNVAGDIESRDVIKFHLVSNVATKLSVHSQLRGE